MDRIRNYSRHTARCAVVLAAVFVSAAHAGGLQDDGCQQLARVVQSQVESLVATGQSAGSNGSSRLAVPDSIVGCGSATAVASGAFSAAFASFGIDVDWNNGMPTDSGDYCLSQRLDQCYPGGGGLLTAFPQSTVQNSWRAVTLSLQRQMPFGEASDIVYFSPVVLGETLATSLRIAVKPGFDPPPDCPAPFGPCRIY